jgi:hypothetical protein
MIFMELKQFTDAYLVASLSLLAPLMLRKTKKKCEKNKQRTEHSI